METNYQFTRAYSDGVVGGSAGATARSKGFSEREQAQEGQYIRDLEKEKLRKLKEKADAANKEVEAQKQRMADNGDKDH
ncbi:hypothetical protein A1Q2_03554 [Trichosporon asahii var. asahii CBS 8904]|uniref:ATPase inhibitor, mitochondrial n=2 Tax=Trichosporon asahii var. asahii TaxID=189963 RepID=K1VRU0_TRIAC|nr:hypothetical protein A1Q1_07450 [Trichosporon asahii var. asahii CBS 2479]EJT53212.1 hypothetical protein A1Q1_07450 [Trichosporon asahii var. asahii CBS 2479]EKD02192.1 hypothetical protein A1Q2_03554 [Trichosporon asahii var. asahii CBS 8904]